MTYRRTTIIAGCLAALAATGGCAETPVAAPADGEAKALFDQVVAMGFHPSAIVDRGRDFLVEGDMVIEKAALAAENGPGAMRPSFQYVSNARVTAVNTMNITVNFNSLASYPTYLQAFRDAIAHWAAIGTTKLRFVETTGTALITVTTFSAACVPYQACLAADAKLPANGKPGNEIRVNVGFDAGSGPGGQMTVGEATLTLAHELGHTVGFRHTSMYLQTACGVENPGPAGANLITGTPTSDPASVMNGCTTLSSWIDFSFYDRMATRRLFPGDGPTAAGSIENGRAKVSWTAARDAASYEVWQVYDSGMGTSSHTVVGTTTGTSLVISWLQASRARACYLYEPVYQVVSVFPGGFKSGFGQPICFE